jgi:hypothetical protein
MVRFNGKLGGNVTEMSQLCMAFGGFALQCIMIRLVLRFEAKGVRNYFDVATAGSVACGDFFTLFGLTSWLKLRAAGIKHDLSTGGLFVICK